MTHRSYVRVAGRRLRLFWCSPWAPALVVLLGFGGWLFVVFHSGHEARDFILVGSRFVRQSHSSAVIALDPHYHYLPGSTGYDGQFSYFIALDPIHARDYLDTRSAGAAGPDYRYTRILYPMAARVLALGQANAIPFTLIALNWLSLAMGTLAVAGWLHRKRLSPWFSLLFGLYPGLFVALQRDLNEALAYALVALAVYFLDLNTRLAMPAAALIFGLASLGRETTLLFPVGYAVGALGTQTNRVGPAFRRDWWAFVTLSVGPFLLWKGFLLHWLGSIGRSGGVYPQPVPLGGLFSSWPWGRNGVEQLVAVALPGLVCLCLGVWVAQRYGWRPELWVLVLNVLVLVVFLNAKSYAEYYASGRIATGVVLAAIYCLPLWQRDTVTRWSIWLCALLWFSLLPALSLLTRRQVQPLDLAIDVTLVLFLWGLVRFTKPENPTVTEPHIPGEMAGAP